MLLTGAGGDPAGRRPRAETRVATLLICGVDEVLGRQLGRLADEVGLAVIGSLTGESPDVVVVDLAKPEALDEIRSWRARLPDVVIAAYLAVPQRDRWEAAERAGADLVSNRGAFVRRLRHLLTQLDPGSARRRRTPLFDAGEVAGRLGLIKSVKETPVGPIAVYRSGSGLVGIADLCPHAGAVLSEGAVEDGVLTCPGHGSQFDVCTGERVRGPADQGIKTYTVIEEDGRVWLLWL